MYKYKFCKDNILNEDEQKIYNICMYHFLSIPCISKAVTSFSDGLLRRVIATEK